MDYQYHYDKLIENARVRRTLEYTERHHVIPRCLGGDNSTSNLVDLTPEEHYIAHQLLVKMYPNHNGLIWAAVRMCTHNGYVRRSNKLYGWVRRRHQSVLKSRTGDKNPSFGTHWYHNPQTQQKGKFPRGTQPEGWIKGTKSYYCIDCETQISKQSSGRCRRCSRIRYRSENPQGFVLRKQEFIDLYKQGCSKSKALRLMGYNPSCKKKIALMKQWLAEESI